MKNYLAQTFFKRCFVFILSSSLLYSSTVGTLAGLMAFMPTNVFATSPSVGLPGIEDEQKSDADKKQEELCKKMEEKDSDSCKDMERKREEQMIEVEQNIADAEDIESSLHHSNVMSVIIMIAAVLSAITFCLQCVNQVSAILFSLGSILYIILDIIGWTKLKSTDEFLRKEMEFKKNQDATELEATTETITAANEELTAAMEHINFRKTGAIITIVLWIIAFVMAILEMLIEVITFGTKNSVCIGVAKTVWTPFNQPSNYVTIQKTEVFDFFDINNIINEKTNNPVSIAMAPHVTDSFVFSKENASQTKQNLFNMIRPLLNSIFPEAKAEGSTPAEVTLGALGVIGLVVLIIVMVKVPLDATLIGAGPNGIVRAVVIAVFIAMVAYNISLLSAAASKIEERIEKLNKILERIKIKTEGLDHKLSGTAGTSIGKNGMGNITSDGVPLEVGAGAGTCVQSNVNTGSAQNVDCKVCEPNCGNFGPEEDFSNFQGIVDIPTGAVKIAQDGRSGAKDLSNGKGLSNGLKNTGGQLNASRKLMKDSQKMLNDLLKKKGQPEVNFPAEIKKLTNNLEGRLSGVLKNLNAEQKAAYDAFNSGTSKESGSGNGTGTEDDTYQKLLASKNKGAGTEAPAYALPKLDMNMGEEQPAVDAATISSEDALAKYEINQNDIHNDTGPGLFEIIAVRYRKSAYPAFFKKKEVTAPVAAPATAPSAIPVETKK